MGHGDEMGMARDDAPYGRGAETAELAALIKLHVPRLGARLDRFISRPSLSQVIVVLYSSNRQGEAGAGVKAGTGA